MLKNSIPVVDLFAGPGGLGEGFSRVVDAAGRKVFKTIISVEKDQFARQTLRLRSYYRHYRESTSKIPDAYFQLIRARTPTEKAHALRLLAEDDIWKTVS